MSKSTDPSNSPPPMQTLTVEQLHALPTITDHAGKRWDERTPDEARSIGHGWTHGRDIEYVTEWFEDEHGNGADEVRLYHGKTAESRKKYCVLLIRRGPAIRTVYPLSFVKDNRVREYLTVMRDQRVFYEGVP